MKQILRLAEFSKWYPHPSTLRMCHSSKVGTPQCATPISLTPHAALTSSSKSSQISQPQTKFEDPCTHPPFKKRKLIKTLDTENVASCTVCLVKQAYCIWGSCLQFLKATDEFQRSRTKKIRFLNSSGSRQEETLNQRVPWLLHSSEHFLNSSNPTTRTTISGDPCLGSKLLPSSRYLAAILSTVRKPKF